jgi:protein Tex
VKSVNTRLAEELAVGEGQVAAAVRLLDEGATVPFIARYRKEVTGSLDDTRLRTLEDRLRYLRELDDRRAAVLASIEEQGKLTDELKAALMAADTKSRVEDIYLPFKPKRRTKAQIAREAGLEPLADRLLADPTVIPDEGATEFIGERVADAAAALDGARHILIERAAEDAELVGTIRTVFWAAGSVHTKPCSEDAAKALRRKSSGTISSSPSHSRACRRTGCSPSCAARRSERSHSASTAVTTMSTRPWSRRRSAST